MTGFRPCPSFPGYSATLCGIIRRDKPRADGSPKILKAKATRVNIAGTGPMPIDRLVHDAWSDVAPPVTSVRYSRKGDRPEFSYTDGRVITVAEWMAEKRGPYKMKAA